MKVSFIVSEILNWGSREICPNTCDFNGSVGGANQREISEGPSFVSPIDGVRPGALADRQPQNFILQSISVAAHNIIFLEELCNFLKPSYQSSIRCGIRSLAVDP